MADTPSGAGGAAPHDAPAAAQADVLLGAEDLPAFCPNPRMPIWSGHPRVFLAVTPASAQSCPYCGTRYALRPGVKPFSH